MRRTAFLGVVAVVSLVAVFSFARAREAPAHAAPSWEYRLVYLPEIVSIQEAMKDPRKTVGLVEAKYNELGRDGWDYCENSNGTAVFKRPRP